MLEISYLSPQSSKSVQNRLEMQLVAEGYMNKQSMQESAAKTSLFFAQRHDVK
jgi:hypothetical protein